jgi:cytochrome c553
MARWSLGILFLALLPASAARAQESPTDLFEKKVRPVLVAHCFACHSGAAKKLEGKLRLDSREGMLLGGESGPAIVPGEPEHSLLVTAVRYVDPDLSMPPKERLSGAEVATLEAWIKAGAPWPRESAPVAVAPVVSLWALEPVRDPAPPEVREATLVATPIDRFVLARLEARGLTFAPLADKRTLLRRATFDLTGLPPTPEETDAFVRDASPDAYERVIDRLLASPRYGERWGRYWLDVARYADTKGYVFNEERRYSNAYTYRDWVIRALNEDLPYDRFLIEQIAADRLPRAGDDRDLAALGFLTLGRRFLNNPPDIIDDRIDVVMRGTMALTVGCARCHDHKFDPIPTKDYYSLYGVFAASREPSPEPLLVDPPAETPDYAAFKKELAEREAEIEAYRQKTHEELVQAARKPESVGQYLLLAHEAGPKLDDHREGALADAHGLSPLLLRRWRKLVGDGNDPVFAPFHALAALPESELAARAGEAVAAVASRSNPLVVKALAATPPRTMRDVAAIYTRLFMSVEKPARDKDEEALRQVLYGPHAPPSVPFAETEGLYTRLEHDKLRELRNKVDLLVSTHPGAPPRAMALEDQPAGLPRVFVRGNPGNLGDEVPRQFPLAVAGPARKPFRDGSGRLELARAIASPGNPLTARVAVNRVWLHHFGAGLVRTPSDFGSRSEPPSHPELLDWLATRFVEGGWSLKKLHRLILLSRVYRQSSEDTELGRRIDPENTLLSRANVRRLDFEAMRDALLAVSGQLDETVGGRSVELTTAPYSRRRTVYGFIDRQNLPGMFRVFDFATPDTTSPQRFETTVPQQALFLLNNAFVLERARGLAARTETRDDDPELRVQALYRLAFGRAASPGEVTLGVRFVLGQALEASPAWQYGWGELDPATRRIKAFTPLPHFTGSAWQGGPVLPDPKLGWCMLNATGGHPGNDLHHAVIRRWIAPATGVVSIEAKLHHPEKHGDGVQARIVSSKAGELGAWVAHGQEVATNLDRVAVQAGEALDFYVDCRTNEGYDSFSWAPVIRQGATESRASADFSGPAALSPWEKYAHVLLLTDEFHFVE